MKKYNELLARCNKAEKYLDCYNLTGQELEQAIKERERYIPDYQKIINELDRLSKQIIANGYKMQDYEYIDGFRQVEYISKEGIA